MWRTCLPIQILLCCFNSGLCRRYDLQSEAIKLYGEDLNNLLMRFRRSPEYMDILNDKVQQLKTDFEDMMGQISFAYMAKLEQKVNETIFEKYKTQEEDKKKGLRRWYYEETTTASPIEKLDNHDPLLSYLTVAERNSFKELGFKFSADAIHALIMQAETTAYDDPSGAPEGPIKSTHMEKDQPTTEHIKDHEETPGTPNLYRYMYRAANDSKAKDNKEKAKKVSKKGAAKKGRRFGLFQPDTQKLVYDPQSIFNDWLKSFDLPEYKNFSTTTEIVGRKKFKPGVYEAEPSTLGVPTNNTILSL